MTTESMAACPALMISAPGSGQGKTTVTAALARWHSAQGAKVRVFKAGPDFLDPVILERASGNPVFQLDLWLMGVTQCRRQFYEAARDADLILIEGDMGLFDGEPCSADLADLFRLPVVAVVNVAGVAQTLGAIAYGLAHYRAGFARRVDAAAVLIGATELVRMPPPVSFIAADTNQAALPPLRLLEGQRIAIARDAAFSVVYQENLRLLERLGATLTFFSPLHHAELTCTDSVYPPGGAPERHLRELQVNLAMKQALVRHCASGKPLYAEGAGLLYLFESLTDKDGLRAGMLGVLRGRTVMQRRLQGVGYQTMSLPQGKLRCHTHRCSTTVTAMPPALIAEPWHDDGRASTSTACMASRRPACMPTSRPRLPRPHPCF